MMEDRDMMYGGYCQNTPGNMAYGNFGYQMPPGSLQYNSLMPNPFPNNMPMNTNTMPMQNSMIDNNPLIDINARLSNLENRVKTIEQRLTSGDTNQYQDDNSMYML